MTTSDTSRPLPCRQRILPDEWIETYLIRVARANGIRHPWQSDIELFRPVIPATATSGPDGFPTWGGVTLPRWSVVGRGSKIRYCPACMQQSRHIRARWRLAAFEVCTIHHIRLKDDLIEPAITANYRQGARRPLAEITDDQLWVGAVCPMPIERQHVERLWSGFERAILKQDNDEAVSVLACSIFLERLLDALATSTYGVDYPASKDQRSLHRANFSAKYRFPITATLDGIRNFLNRMSEPAHRRAALSQLRRMLVQEARKPTCLSRIPIIDLRDRLLASLPEIPVTPTPGGLPGEAHPVGYVSLERAEFLIGCRPRLLHHLIQHKKIEGVRVVARGMKRYTFLPHKEVELCRRWYRSLRTPEHAIQDLHIDQRSYRILLGAGLLHPTTIDSRTYYQESELADLCRRLDEVSRAYPEEPTDLHPLFGEWIFAKGVPRAVSVEMVKEIFDGELPIYRRLGNLGLSAYYVEFTALERMQRLRRIRKAHRKHREISSHQFSLLPE